VTFELLDSRLVLFDMGYAGALPSQVTKIRVDGIIGWVREWRRASSLESFTLSSAARLGHKRDGNRIGQEVLELAAPKAHWDRLAEAIASHDTLKRSVVSNRRWTTKTAPDYFERRR
jgi:hypothetical protein